MAGHNGNGNGRVVPAAFPPPVDSVGEFIKREVDPEDEVIEVGVCIVGGGTAGLACANRLLQLLGDDPEMMERLGEVHKEAIYALPNGKTKLRIPTPPPQKNHGNEVISVAKLARYQQAQAEEGGAYVLTETSATQLLVEDGPVRGVRTGDKGRGKDGEPLSNFEPGT